MPHFLLIGESLFDIIVTADGSVAHVGGSPLNVAVGVRRQGYPVRFATWFGRDTRGQQLLDFFAAEDISIVPGSDGAAETSTAIATLDESGAASYEFHFTSDLPDGLVADGHIHIGSISATTPPGAERIRAFVAAAQDDWTVSYDPNIRPSLMGAADDIRPHIEALISTADVVKASDEDVTWLYPGLDLPAVLAHWHGLGPRLAVITQGGAGALSSLGGEVISVAAPETVVVDTVGAGDSFMAGLIGGLAGLGFLGDAAARNRLAAATWDEVRPAVENALARAAAVVAQAGAEGAHPAA